jgi:hypothetical protein
MILDVKEEKYPKLKFVVYVWETPANEADWFQQITYSEEHYKEMDDWCKETLGRRTRTAYNIFEFKNHSHLEWFILRWQ